MSSLGLDAGGVSVGVATLEQDSSGGVVGSTGGGGRGLEKDRRRGGVGTGVVRGEGEEVPSDAA